MNIASTTRAWMPACRALTAALSLRDGDTGEHSRRVYGLAHELGMACGLSAAELCLLDLGAMLHDVGKIGTPDDILLKHGELDVAERDCMREHAALGEQLILDAGLESAEALARIVRHHHEAYDGSGYPDGLAGSAIPLPASLVSLVDAYDAIGSARPYHAAQPHRMVLAIMEAESGSKTDPDLFRVFLSVIERSPLKLA